jgi:hypothetical protein
MRWFDQFKYNEAESQNTCCQSSICEEIMSPGMLPQDDQSCKYNQAEKAIQANPTPIDIVLQFDFSLIDR